MPFRRLDAAAAQYLMQLLTRLFATYAIVQGAGIILGGSQRWSSSKALATALALPGAPATWGALLLLAGALALYGTFRSPRVTRIGCFGISVWSFCFALALVPNLVTSFTASTTGVFVYGKDAIAAMVLAVAYRHVRA